MTESSPQKPGRGELLDAVIKKDAPRVKELLERGADVEEADENGNSALMRAMEANLEIVGMLVDRGADPHKKYAFGLTPRQYISDQLQVMWNREAFRDGAIKILDEAPERRQRFLDGIAQKAAHEKTAEKQRHLQERAFKIKLKPKALK